MSQFNRTERKASLEALKINEIRQVAKKLGGVHNFIHLSKRKLIEAILEREAFVANAVANIGTARPAMIRLDSLTHDEPSVDGVEEEATDGVVEPIETTETEEVKLERQRLLDEAAREYEEQRLKEELANLEETSLPADHYEEPMQPGDNEPMPVADVEKLVIAEPEPVEVERMADEGCPNHDDHSFDTTGSLDINADLAIQVEQSQKLAEQAEADLASMDTSDITVPVEEPAIEILPAIEIEGADQPVVQPKKRRTKKKSKAVVMNDEDVRLAHQKLLNGEKLTEVAKQFGVHYHSIMTNIGRLIDPKFTVHPKKDAAPATVSDPDGDGVTLH